MRHAREEDDRLLEVEEAARRLAVSTDTLYRKARELPFTVRIGGMFHFSAQGMSRFIATRQGRVAFRLASRYLEVYILPWAEEASSGKG